MKKFAFKNRIPQAVKTVKISLPLDNNSK
jgi:hypothetical protein